MKTRQALLRPAALFAPRSKRTSCRCVNARPQHRRQPAACRRHETWSDAIEGALRAGDGVYIPAQPELYYLDRPVILRSGQSLIAAPGAEIRLEPGSNTCMVRNEGVVGFQDGSVPDTLETDTDILVQGGIWTTLAGKFSNGSRRQRWR